MSKRKRLVITTGGQTSTGAGNSQSIPVDKLMAGVPGLTSIQMAQAEKLIVQYKSSIEAFVAQMTSQLPSKDRLGSLKVVILLLMHDLSGSESGYEALIAELNNLVIQTVMDESPLATSTIVGVGSFNTSPTVIMPLTLMEGAESMKWLTPDLSAEAEAHQQYYRQINADGGTDINYALIAAICAGMYTDAFYRQLGCLPKVIIVTGTDGGQNGKIPAGETAAFIAAARSRGNMQMPFFVIGDPATEAYVLSLGLPESSVLGIERTPESMRAAAFSVSAGISGSSTAAGDLRKHDFFQLAVQIPSEQLQLLELPATIGDNPFAMLEDVPEEEFYEED